jgi:hypothetical protein
LILNKSPDVAPALREQIVVATRVRGEPEKRINRAEVPQVDALFNNYMKGVWAGWAAAERPRRTTIASYNKLFLLHQALEAEGTDTPLELVWGLGVAIWKHASGRLIRFPLITQLVEIGFDQTTLSLEVRPRDRLPSLETDAYASLEVPGVVHLEGAWKGYLDNGDFTLSPFDGKSIEGLLRPAAGFLDAGGVYWPDVQNDRTSRTLPAVTGKLGRYRYLGSIRTQAIAEFSHRRFATAA